MTPFSSFKRQYTIHEIGFMGLFTNQTYLKKSNTPQNLHFDRSSNSTNISFANSESKLDRFKYNENLSANAYILLYFIEVINSSYALSLQIDILMIIICTIVLSLKKFCLRVMGVIS